MDHYRVYLAALSAYESFVCADPALLTQSTRGRALKAVADVAWQRYYAACYGSKAADRDRSLLTALTKLLGQLPQPNLDDPDLDAAIDFANATIANL